MTRDLCHGKKAKYVRRTAAYKASRNGRLTGPGHYDYPGVDDGSRCPQNGGFFEEDEEMEQKAGARCGWNAATNRCVKGADNKMDGANSAELKEPSQTKQRKKMQKIPSCHQIPWCP